ncbi:MAG: aminotransferase class V-fold PLP-dependent enzyme, partial [Chloroflexota bacterium]
YGPKGVGILFVRQGVDLVPMLTGGGQEGGRRAGTVNVPFAVGAAEALRLAARERAQTTAHYLGLSGRLIDGLLGALPEKCVLTGHPTQRLPHNASFAFRGISGNDLLMHLDVAGVSASSGSACLTGDPKPSTVLEALGLGPEWTKGGLRLTVGRQNTLEDVDYALAVIPSLVGQLERFNKEFA